MVQAICSDPVKGNDICEFCEHRMRHKKGKDCKGVCAENGQAFCVPTEETLENDLAHAKHMMELWYKVSHRAQTRASEWYERFRVLLHQEIECSSNTPKLESS